MEVCTNLLPLLLIERKRTTRAEQNKIYFTILRSWQYTFTKTQVTRSSKKKKKTQVTLADTHGSLVEQKKTTRAEEKKNYFTILTSWQYTFTMTRVTHSHLLRDTRHFIFAFARLHLFSFCKTHVNSHKYTYTPTHTSSWLSFLHFTHFTSLHFTQVLHISGNQMFLFILWIY